ncbi:MAG: hypothetical protein HJHJAOHD_00173 [Flavobacteriales bacterium]|nr:hypothetical protein [Flavobacteriales bacterium]MCL4816424.1 T9SS type A sorting domain-containing protein [Flavobacteriales bacterium]WKZ73947.1 MAG: T9SS type A sorting domain-containing protein [Vicingaceae bacterium]
MLVFLHTLSNYAQLAKNTVFQDWVGNNGSQAFFQKSVVRSDASGNAHIAGATLNQNGNYDLYLAKYNASGVLLWDVVYAGAEGWHDAAADMRVDTSGNVYVTGSVFTSSNDSNDVITTKYKSNGTELWGTYFGNEVNTFGKTISLDAQSYVYITGKTQLHSPYIPFPGTNPQGAYVMSQQPSAGPNPSGFVASFGPQQEHVWSTYLGGEYMDEFRSACVSPDNKLYFVGITNTNNNNVTNGNFFPLEELILGTAPPYDYYQNSFPAQTNFIGFAGRFDLEVIQSAPLAVKEDKPIPDGFRIYPNPSNEYLNIVWNEELAYPFELKISDMSGRIVLNKTIQNNEGITTVDVSSFANGIYTIQLLNNKTNVYEKFCKQQ